MTEESAVNYWEVRRLISLLSRYEGPDMKRN